MNSVIDTPVNTTTDDTVITNDVKKKRGRKKKETTLVTEEPKIPKKRGRKPKGGKLINAPINNNNDSMSISNIILHLKCSLTDLNDYHNADNNNIIIDPIEYIANPPPTVVAYNNN